MKRTPTLVVVTLAVAASLWLATSWILASGAPVAAALPQAGLGVYTITFQQDVSPAGYAGATDTWIDAWHTSDNHGLDAVLRIKGDGPFRALLRFELEQYIPAGARVISAALLLRVTDSSAATSIRAVAYPILQPWVASEATWNLASQGVSWWGAGCEGLSRSTTPAASTDISQAPGEEVAWDVTSAVQAWIDNPASNKGLLLNGEVGSASYVFASSNYPDASSHPRLVVTYEGSAPMATPTPTSTPTKTATPSDYRVLTSTPADWVFDSCLKVNEVLHVSIEEQMVLIWQGNPWSAALELTVCNSSVAHPIFVNGVQVGTTPLFETENCECNDGLNHGYAMSFPLDLALVRSGPTYSNVITVSNEAADWDRIKIYGARIVLMGQITGTSRSYFTIGTDYDGTPIQGAMQLPIGYNPSAPTPLLISVPGTYEDKNNGLIRHMVGANQMGWLLASLDMRRSRPSEAAKPARSPSLAVQHDIMNLVQYMQAHYNVDRSRIYIAGFSTGGGIAATMAAKYPDVFAGALDYAGPTSYSEWYYERLDIAAELEGEFGGDPTNNFEYPRRSSRSLARNLQYVPVRIVHGTADETVPFAQSSGLYTDTMPLFYDRAATFKEIHPHPGGHFDHVPGISETDLQFLSQHTLTENPGYLNIITDEAKGYYWLRVDKSDRSSTGWGGWVEVEARYDPITSTIWVTAKDGEFAEGKSLTVTLNLSKMGLNTALSYDIEESDPHTGDFLFHAAVSPVGGKLAFIVPRNSLGLVDRSYLIYPASGRIPTVLRLQQGVDGYTAAKDTYIDQSSAATHGSADRLNVAYDLRRKALLQFGLGSVPAGKIMKAAKLTVYLLDTHSSGISLGAYEARRSWLDTEATWERATQSQLWTVAGADGIGTDRAGAATYAVNNMASMGSYTLDVKPLVQQWIGTPASNLGLFLIGTGPYTTDSYALASAEYSDSSKRPVLEIWYMDPLPTPTVTPTAVATRTPTPTRTATATPTVTPTPTATPGAAILQGRVTLQGRPAPPDSHWIVTLAVRIGDMNRVATTDSSGYFTISGLTPGTYDICVKNSHTVSTRKTGVVLVAGTNTVDLGTLREGDADNSNQIDISDFVILRAAYSTSDARADFNQDGRVDISDFVLLRANYSAWGDCSVLGSPANDAPPSR